MADLHEVAVTAIIVWEGKYLIIQRSADKKRFPEKWVVPGGRLEQTDYTDLPKDTEHYWYNVIERTLRREIKEEVGLEIARIDYLTSLARVHEDGAPSLVISCIADYAAGEVQLQEGETQAYAWVSTEEAASYDLIDGIYDELVMADQYRAGERAEWNRAQTA